MSETKIPFNKPYLTGRELSYIAKAHEGNMLAGDGPFTEADARRSGHAPDRTDQVDQAGDGRE